MIPAGAVVPLPATVYDISFVSSGRHLEYRLDPGTDYALRYDASERVDLFVGSHGRDDAPDLAPYVATPMIVVHRMLELAGVGEKDTVYDLGCGDGRIVVAADLSRATVVTLYLLPESNALLRPLMERELAAGVRVVSHNYEIAGWMPSRQETVLDLGGSQHSLYSYVMGRHRAPGTR